MSSHAPHLPFALDPLIAEAKRRARRRRFVVAVGVVLLGVAALLALQLPSSGGGASGGLVATRSPNGLSIPTGANGIAVIVYGRLSVTTKTGFHIHGVPAREGALAPGARYVAAEMGQSLTEIAPNGRRVWSHRIGVPVANCGACNSVAAIAWSPNGSQIAYLVRDSMNSRAQGLHVIWRDGTHDTVIDRDARSGSLSWRADSRALAYIGARSRPTIYDLAKNSRHVISWHLARSPATRVAFAPHGRELAIRAETAALLVGSGDNVVWRGQTQTVNWVGDRLAVSERIAPSGRSVTQLYTVTGSRATLSRTLRLPGPIIAARGRTIALEDGNRVLAGRLGALRRVFRFTVKPCSDSAGTLVLSCEIPMGWRDISLG